MMEPWKNINEEMDSISLKVGYIIEIICWFDLEDSFHEWYIKNLLFM